MNSGDNPTWSIIIPTYNYAHFLPGTLESVFLQQRNDIQLVLIDDASDDNTYQVIEPFLDRIEYFRNEENLGAAGAWKVGLSRATGKYVIKLDADDAFLPGHLDRVEEAFESYPDAAMVMCSVLINRENDKPPEPEFLRGGNSILSPEQFRDRFLHGFFFRMPGCAVRRACLEGHSLPKESLYQVHDWEYFLRVTKGHGAVLIGQPSAIYRLHSSSITSTARQKNRLRHDIDQWLSSAVESGTNSLEDFEQNILRGSFAILLVSSGVRGLLDPQFFKNYLTAASLALKGGLQQFVRLHYELTRKLMRLLVRPFRGYADTRLD